MSEKRGAQFTSFLRLFYVNRRALRYNEGHVFCGE